MTSHDSANDASSRDGNSKPRYWRSLSELHQREEFQDYLQREFPVAASEFPEGVSRRKWMQLMGASFAIAGVAGCRYPEETIEPFVIRPEGRMPGETYSRATNFELADRVYNLLVTCFDGRPLKIEPNTDHPTGGGTDAYAQACVLSLYDPDRARGDQGFLLRLSEKGRRREVGWDQFDPYGQAMIKAAASNNQGSKFAVLTPPTTSPSIIRMLKAVKEKLPNSTIARYDGVTGDAMRQATTAVFGKPATQVLNLEEADIILTLQADILGQDTAMLRNAKGFAKRRDPGEDPEKIDMNRLYVVEGGFTLTGAAADSRLALRPSQMPAFLSELGRRVAALRSGEPHSHGDESKAYDQLSREDRLERFLDVLAHDVYDAGEKAVVVVGEHLGPEAIAAGIQMNKQLGSYGTLQTFNVQPDAALGETVSLSELTDKINNGDVESLLILGGNPVTTSPGDVNFLDALGKLEQSVYLGEYDDETGEACDWSLPLAHPLESWGDCVDAYGHYGVCQPQILPLLGGRTVVEVLAVMLGESETEGSKIIRRTADAIAGKSLAEREWRKLLHDGHAAYAMVKSEELTPAGEAKELTADAPVAAPDLESDSFKDNIEVLFVAADGLYDGRFANNGWLQEMPQSLTKLAWDNAAILSPATAKAMGLRHGLKITLRTSDSSIELPIYEMPGCAAGVVTVTLGYGRTRVGAVGGMPGEETESVGVDVSPLRTSDAMMMRVVEARPNFEEYELSTTQDHWAIDDLGRQETSSRSFNLVREGTTELLKKVPEFANAQPKEPHVPHVGKDGSGSPWQEPVNEIQTENRESGSPTPQWGMSIDLGKCTGCNACVVACQSENNVPIVGREQVMNSREMHWLRIDRYFQGDEENADIVQEPMACQHCETAPCEQVCPVAATIHTNEGINAMAYNRCIGTRYCANNCPFKVRRFNYFNYNEDVGVGYGVKAYPGTIQSANRKLQALVLNPDVTVRGRGVMEKCTYCVQRVENAKIEARKRDGKWEIRDGDVVTACQAACPTRAIEFGDIEDKDAVVSKKRESVRSYGMLGQLNIKPRTEYLARVRNPDKRLMTTAQLHDLDTITKPHHGHGHDDHEGEHAGDHDHDEKSGEDHHDESHEEKPSEAAAAE